MMKYVKIAGMVGGIAFLVDAMGLIDVRGMLAKKNA